MPMYSVKMTLKATASTDEEMEDVMNVLNGLALSLGDDERFDNDWSIDEFTLDED